MRDTHKVDFATATSKRFQVNPQGTRGVPLLTRGAEILAVILLVSALLSIQTLIGGTRLLFALPAYGLLAVLGTFAIGWLTSAKPSPDQICLWSAVVFFGYIELRATYSPVPYLARFDIYSVLAGLIVYLFVSCILTSAKARMAVFACLIAAALAHVLVGVIQFTGGKNFMPISFLQRFDYERRASGFYICPNHLAGLLEVLGIFGLSIVCWSRWPVWSRLLIGYATAMSYIGVILTGSRGGYLSVMASLAVFGLLSLNLLRAGGAVLLLRIGGAGLIAGALALIVTFSLVQKSDFLSDRARTVLDDKNIRPDLWRAALQQWKLAPLLGTGSRTYLFYGRMYRTERVQSDPIYVHNDYLQLLSEYGIAGTALFLSFLVAHLRRGLTDAGRLGPKRIAVSHRLASNAMALNIAALSAVAAYIVHSIFDFNLHIPANVLLLAFVFGILANPGVAPRLETRPAKSLVFWRGVLVALALFLGMHVWRIAPGEYYTERGRAALRDYRFLSAIGFALKGLDYEKQNPALFYYLGRARSLGAELAKDPQARTSFYESALPAYASARALAPLDVTYALELALTYDALERFGEAEWMYDEALALDPRSTSAKRYYEAHLERWKTGHVPTEDGKIPPKQSGEPRA